MADKIKEVEDKMREFHLLIGNTSKTVNNIYPVNPGVKLIFRAC